MNDSSSSRPIAQKNTGIAMPAFLIGIPLAALILFMIHRGPFNHYEQARRYVHHPVEVVEVILFCCAVSALGAKLWTSRHERAILRRAILPAWDGQPVPVDEAPKLMAELARLPYRLQNTFLACRVSAVLDFLCSRRSANDLDDQLRTLTDNDSLAMEGSYSLTRFITWAIPILGFLGTVLGITGAISGVTPEVLEKSLSTVTDGLALAFDATALGLALTMVTMFMSFIVERTEQGVLDGVDRYVDRQLAHRFERIEGDSGEFTAVVRRNTSLLMQGMEQLVQKQAEVWTRSMEEMAKSQQQAADQVQQQMTAALETALEKSLESHARRLAAHEKQTAEHAAFVTEQTAQFAFALREITREQQVAITPLTQAVSAQTESLTRHTDSQRQLLQLQQALSENIASLADALQGFELRVATSEFRVRLEAPEARPQVKLARPGKAA